MNILKKLATTALVTYTLLGSTAVQANVISGRLWHVPESVTLMAIPANIPARLPDVIFDVTSPMNFFGDSPSVGSWLASSSAFNIVENTVGTLTTLMDDGSIGSLLEFTGFVTVTDGQQFTVTHDDGVTLIIGGVDLGFDAGPISTTTSSATYSGPSGNFPFQLIYAECCGGAAVLQINLPFDPLPEPATLALLGLSLTGLCFSRRSLNSKGKPASTSR